MIDPPYSTTPGIFIRASAMPAAGIVLSHATKIITPSSECPFTASSIESAITSRDMRDARMPSLPMVMPSDTAIELKSTGVPPAARIPARTGTANLSRSILHGPILVHVLKTAIIGPSKFSSSIPVARSIARAAARLGPFTIASLLLLIILAHKTKKPAHFGAGF